MDDESGSDWDSLTGDVEPQSAPEVTPRPASVSPVPPPVKTTTQQRKVPTIKSPREDQSERTSTPNSVVAAVKKEDQNIEMSPRNFYGKPGVTTFVDRGGQESDEEVSTRSNRGPRKTNKKQTETRQKTPPTTEGQVPEKNIPFTLFQASGMQSEKPQMQPQPPKQKVKTSYIKTENPNGLRLQRPTGSQDRWDSSDEEQNYSQRHQSRPPVTPGLVSVGYAPHSEVVGSTQGLLQNHSPDPAKKNASYNQTLSMHIPDCCVPLGPSATVERYTYYFDEAWHLPHTLVTKDDKPEAFMPLFADRSEQWVRRLWQEFFGALRLIIDFIRIFILELFEFVIHWIVLKLLIGILLVVGDHAVKPILTALFNSLIQPVWLFFWNTSVGIKNVIRPFLEIIRECTLQIATVLRAFRLVEVNWRPEFNNSQRRNDHMVSEL